jgi:hypothetical protein
MLKMATLAVTHGGHNEHAVDAWNVAPMQDAYTGEKHGPWVGEKALDFMAQFDIVLLWHWPSELMARLLGIRRTRVVPFLELDAVKTYPEWSPINETLRQVFVSGTMGRHLSERENSFGHPFIDIYETSSSQWDSKPHAWSIKLDSGLHEAYALVLKKVWDSYAVKPYAVVVDSMNYKQYFGTASNKPSQEVFPPWSVWLDEIERRVCPVWAHSGGFFHDTIVTISELGLASRYSTVDIMREISTARNAKRQIGLAPQTRAEVDRFHQLVKFGFGPDIVQVARSGKIAFDIDYMGQ